MDQMSKLLVSIAPFFVIFSLWDSCIVPQWNETVTQINACSLLLCPIGIITHKEYFVYIIIIEEILFAVALR